MIDYGSQHIICATKKGLSFDVVSYNLLMGMLLSSLDEAQLTKSVESIEALPTTIVIDKANKKHIDLGKRAIDLSESVQRQALLSNLHKIEQDAQDSRASWELLEHKLFPADEVFNHEFCLKLHTRVGYVEFNVLHADFIKASEEQSTAITIRIALDVSYLCKHAEEVFAQNTDQKEASSKLLSDQIVHIKPQILNPSGGEYILLSQLISFLSKIHVIVKVEDTGDGTSDAEVFNIIFEDFKTDPDYVVMFQSEDGEKIHWVDYTIPEDGNILLGTCRDIEQDF